MWFITDVCTVREVDRKREAKSQGSQSHSGGSARFHGEHWRGSDASECILTHGRETGLSHFSLHQPVTGWGYPGQGDPGGQAAPVSPRQPR